MNPPPPPGLDGPPPSSLPLQIHDATVDRSASASQGSVTDSTEYPTTYSTTSLVRESYVGVEMPHGHETQNGGKELPRLQANGQLQEGDDLDPILEDDPASFHLVSPAPVESEVFSLEKQTLALFSKGHLQVIFADPSYLFKFTSFLGLHRPQSVPVLVHYLDSLKSLRAINYANAICEGLDFVEGYEFYKDGGEAYDQYGAGREGQSSF